MANGFNLKVYGTQRGDTIAPTPTYPTVGVSNTVVAAIEPYVNTQLSITDGAKVILKAANVNGGLPTAYLSNATVSDVMTLWNA